MRFALGVGRTPLIGNLLKTLRPALMGDGYQVTRNHLRRFGFALPQNRLRRRARPLTVWPARLGINGCSAFKDRRSLPRRWAMHSMPVTSISKSTAWDAHPSDCCAEHRQAAEDDADPRTGTIHTVQGLLTRPYKRSHLVALRPTKISTSDPRWPGSGEKDKAWHYGSTRRYGLTIILRSRWDSSIRLRLLAGVTIVETLMRNPETAALARRAEVRQPDR
jgi:hypothetical protein